MRASSPAPGLPVAHLLLAVAVSAIWGTNFIVIEVGLHSFPPLWFAFLRFTLVFLPAALLVRRPAVPWSQLAAYGLLVGAGQFGLLYIAMQGRITPGLASLAVQSQVFFTIMIAVLWKDERLSPGQWFALSLACAGLAIIAICSDGDATPAGLVMVLLAGLSWAIANIIVKEVPASDMLAYIIWASLFAAPALLGMSLWLEGLGGLTHAISVATPGAWASLLWQASGNTLFGFAAWGWLLSRHSAAAVTPTALLVPVFGMAASVVLLNEHLQNWKVAGGGLILAALCAPRLLTWTGKLRVRVSDS